MEPENDFELRRLLREWKAPDAPPSLASRVLARRGAWRRVLLHGYIRVPVPVACCLAVVMIAGAWRLTVTAPSAGCPAAQLKAPAIEKPRENARTGCSSDSSC